MPDKTGQFRRLPGALRRGSAAATPEDLAWRLLQLLNSARLAVSALLLAMFSLADSPPLLGGVSPLLAFFALIGLIVASTAEYLLLSRKIGSLRQHIYLQATIDIIFIPLLMYASGGASNSIGALLVISIGGLALLLAPTTAFFVAAMATILLLLEQWVFVTSGSSTSAAFVQTGILSAVIFSFVGIMQLLRGRLLESEALAAQRGVDLRNLVELNDYIIHHLRESIVVVDGDDRIRLLNESAARHLAAVQSETGARLRGLSEALADRLTAWRTGVSDDTASTPFEAGKPAVMLAPFFARMGGHRSGGVLIFLEDTSLVAERVQQTKLAALGRLSASIAHEIRNPIGAISHAGQLLAESELIPEAERRLTEIINTNTSRVSTIVDNVLSLSRRDATTPRRLELRRWSRDFVNEFVTTLEIFEGSVSLSTEAQEVDIEIDPTHLHQVAWNLCDNAVKYASATANAIAVRLNCGVLESSGRPYLEVSDRGPGIDPETAENIFEPFFTAQKGGTGLGLYISRELCERNGASLRYHPRPGGGSTFRIVFSDPARWRATADIE